MINDWNFLRLRRVSLHPVMWGLSVHERLVALGCTRGKLGLASARVASLVFWIGRISSSTYTHRIYHLWFTRSHLYPKITTPHALREVQDILDTRYYVRDPHLKRLGTRRPRWALL